MKCIDLYVLDEARLDTCCVWEALRFWSCAAVEASLSLPPGYGLCFRSEVGGVVVTLVKSEVTS